MSVPGLFTHGSSSQRVPHPRIPIRLLLAAHMAFVKAFAMLRSDPPAGFVLSSAGEKAITRQLKDVLANDLLPHGTVPGFNHVYFSYVVRDAELSSYDGQHPDKKPDILVGLQRADGSKVIADQDAIFIECKPVDADHKLTTEYGSNGIRRFVKGEYAWAMLEAMMVAYVRGPHTIAGELRANLRKNVADPRFGKPTQPLYVPASEKGPKWEALHSTRHQRNIVLPATGKAARPILLFHSWHDCN